jgi:tRNA-specific 2-thiouridylase
VWSAGRPPGDGFRCVVQVRAHGGLAPAVVQPGPDGVAVRLDQPLRGVAPGPTVALYDPDPGGDIVLGSATIIGTGS